MARLIVNSAAFLIVAVFADIASASPFYLNLTTSDSIDTGNRSDRGIFGGFVQAGDSGLLGGDNDASSDRPNDLAIVDAISGFNWTSNMGKLSLTIDLDTTDPNSIRFSFDIDVEAFSTRPGANGWLNGNSFGRLGVDGQVDGDASTMGCCGDHNIDLGEDITFTVSNVNTINAPPGMEVAFDAFTSITYWRDTGAVVTGLNTDTLNIGSSQDLGPIVNGFYLEFDLVEAEAQVPEPSALTVWLGMTALGLLLLWRRRWTVRATMSTGW